MLEAAAPAVRELGQVQLVFAELAFAEKNPAAALNHLEAAGRAGGGHPELFNQVGRAYLQLKRWNEAQAAFQKSLEAEPDNPAALDGLARVHLECGEPESAVEKSLQAVGLIHFFPEAHFHLGMGLERLGKAREAILAYETALGIGYQPAVLHHRLAELYRPIDPQKAASHDSSAGQISKTSHLSGRHQVPAATGPGPGGGTFWFGGGTEENEKCLTDSVTIVSGLPRSGTSLMMQMLQAGGMPLADGRKARAGRRQSPRLL